VDAATRYSRRERRGNESGPKQALHIVPLTEGRVLRELCVALLPSQGESPRSSGEAIIRGQQAGVGLDPIRAFSRHRTLQTMLVYRDAREQMAVHRQLAEVVAATLTP
jgi:hypothetical protein